MGMGQRTVEVVFLCTQPAGARRYDSERLIPKVRTTVDVAYITDLMSDFYGFNGYQSIYDTTQIKVANKIFYKNERNMFRAKVDFQGFFF